LFTELDIERVISNIEYHYSMLIFTSLGNEVLSDSEKLLLESFGIDIEKVKEEYPPYLRTFLLGRLASILSEGQMRELDKKDFDEYVEKGQFVPLSQRERKEYEISREVTYNNLKGLANKITNDTRNKLLEENKKLLIKETISEGIKNRESVSSIVSDLGHKTGEWDRDWKRIVVTEMQNIYNQGKAGMIVEKYGEDSLVWRHEFKDACRHCIRLYFTNGNDSAPRVFKLSELIANGSNVGRKVDDWLPTVESTHPHCRGDIRWLPNGQVWNDEIGQFEYSKQRERKVERKSKIKVVVGSKEFLV